tara:strand:- start:304 stop:1485 length:1182 start_codon:yes stop_codon:yes gene_type:complete
MNWIPPKKKTKDEVTSSETRMVLLKNNPGNPFWEWFKCQIKKLPFFLTADLYRRRIQESRLMDFLIAPVAKKLEDWPSTLVLDITNRCNAKCLWCPQPELEELGAMKMELFRKIIDDYSQRGGIVRFGTFGEPLMDKKFTDKVRYLKQYQSIYKIELVTNGYFLNEKITPVLLENGVDVEISLDELVKETFEHVKKMSYDVVRKNVLQFLEANDRMSKPVKVNFRVKSSMNRAETLDHEFFHELSRHKCTMELTPMDEDSLANWAGRFDKEAFYKSHLGETTSVENRSYKQYNKSNPSPCNQLWKWLVVYWDGKVVMCCVDMFATTPLGNLNENTVAEVWNGKTLHNFRKQMIRRKRFDIPLCQDCDLHLGWNYLKTYYGPDGKLARNLNFIS